jgi:hypothetical protein
LWTRGGTWGRGGCAWALKTRRRTRERGSACRRSGRIGAREARGSRRRRACGRLSSWGLGSSSSSTPASACRFRVRFRGKWERVFNGVVRRIEDLSQRILKKEKEEERTVEDVDLDFLYASIIHAVVGGSEQ